MERSMKKLEVEFNAMVDADDEQFLSEVGGSIVFESSNDETHVFSAGKISHENPWGAIANPNLLI